MVSEVTKHTSILHFSAKVNKEVEVQINGTHTVRNDLDQSSTLYRIGSGAVLFSPVRSP